jgi:Flp pilus assembly protein TadD
VVLLVGAAFAIAGRSRASSVDTHTIIEQANQLFVDGKAAEALPLYQRAARMAPNASEVRYDLGLALMRLGRLDDAEREAKAALAIAPDDKNARALIELIAARRSAFTVDVEDDPDGGAE